MPVLSRFKLRYVKFLEILSTEFFSALISIVIIDLVLAGVNAIFIALAARNLPDHLRTKAVVWGTVGAMTQRARVLDAIKPEPTAFMHPLDLDALGAKVRDVVTVASRRG